MIPPTKFSVHGPLLLWLVAAWMSLALPAEASVPIRGAVYGPGGAPVEGARVTLHPASTRFQLGEQLLAGRPGSDAVVATTSAEDGRFTVRAPEPGMWRMQVHARGLVPAQIRLTPLLAAVELEPVSLAADAGLQVRVVDAEDRPVADAAVVAYRRVRWRKASGAGGADYPVPLWYPAPSLGKTDETGWARIPASAGEEVTVQVAAPGFPHQFDTLTRRSDRPVKTVLETAPRRPLIVLDNQGRRAPGVVVFGNGRPYPLGITGEDGSLDLHLPPNEKTRLGLSAADRHWALLQVEARPQEGNIEPLELVLRPPLRVSGRVLDEVRGEPVAGALVWPRGYYAYGTTTDRSGGFVVVLEGEEGGLEAGREGYRPGRGAHLASLLPPGQTSLEAVALHLVPVTRIAGRILDPWGDGVPGVEILPLPQGYSLRGGSRDGSHGVSGEDGAFTLDRMLTGRPYRVRLRAPTPKPNESEDPPPVYADTWTKLDSLQPGEEREGLVWTLELARHGEGWVVDESDRPIPGARVTLRRRASRGQIRDASVNGPPDLYEAVSDAEGRFFVERLAAETYDLTIQASGFAPAQVPGIALSPAEQGIPGPWELGTVTLGPAATISGSVRDPSGRGIEGAEVQAVDPSSGSSLDLPVERQKLITDAEGRFVLGDLAPGDTLDLQARAEGFLPMRGMVVRSPEEGVKIVLERGSRVTGRVVDALGLPIYRARVALHPETTEGFTFRSVSASTGEDGTFELTPTPVGSGTIEVASARFLKERRSVRVPDLDEPPLHLEFTLERGARLEGRAVLDDGTPAVNAYVNAYYQDPRGDHASYSARVDAEGGFVIEGLPQGTLRVSAHKEPYAQAETSVVLDGAAAFVELQFPGGHPVSGRVLDARGEPIAGASVFALHREGASTGRPVASDSQGLFRLEQVTAGDYEIQASLPDGRSGREPLLVSGPVEGVELVVDGGDTVLSGRIEGLDLDDLARVRITAQGPRYREALADFNGRFEISGLGEGNWRIAARIDEDGRFTQQPLEIAPGQREAEVVLAFRPGFEVRGLVRLNGKPTGGLRVLLNDARERAAFQGRTLHDGTFSLRDVPSGEYKVYIYGPRGEQIERRATVDGSADGMELLIDATVSRISGRVLDENGTPIPEATLSIVERSRPNNVISIFSGRDGSFVFPAAEVGTVRLTAERTGYGTLSRELTLRGGDDPAARDLILVLRKAPGETRGTGRP